jgi:hypothetical protein
MQRSKQRCAALAALLSLAGLAGNALAGTVLLTATGPGGHTYALVSDPDASWSEAAADARARGGFLVTIGDAAEQSAVESLLSDANAPSGAYWFGLHETATEGDYRNHSGLAPTYTHWDTLEPNNGTGNEDSGSILWSNPGDATFGRRGLWNDLPDKGGYPALASTFPDLVSAGYVVESFGTGPGFDNGDGDPRPAAPGLSPVPLPAAVWAFPAGALVAAAAARRLRRA